MRQINAHYAIYFN